MELKEFFISLQKEWKLFVGIVVFTVCAVAGFAWLQPDRFTTVLSIHVARTQAQMQTDEYRYDDFYRLQADERFADTVVRWLQSPRIVSDIYSGTGLQVTIPREYALESIFSAKRLSSQYIEVRFSAPTFEVAESLSESIECVLNNRTNNLNSGEDSGRGWFRIVVENPVIYPHHIPWTRLFVGSLLVGIFLGVWIVGFRRYWKKNSQR